MRVLLVKSIIKGKGQKVVSVIVGDIDDFLGYYKDYSAWTNGFSFSLDGYVQRLKYGLHTRPVEDLLQAIKEKLKERGYTAVVCADGVLDIYMLTDETQIVVATVDFCHLY